MLVEDQLVEIKWNNYTKQWYQDKGYIFTHVGDHFKIHIKDLMLTSSVKVLVKCDYCGRTYLKSYCDYNKSTKMGTQKNACSHCGHKKSLETKNTKEIYYKKFCEMCKAKGYIPLSSQSDYINAHCKLKFLCPVHGEQEITYASLYSGCGCNLCGYTKSSEANRKSISEVIKIVESKNNNKILNPEEYINASTPNLKIMCGSCGNTFTTSLSSIENSDGACLSCAQKKTGNTRRLTPDEVEKKVNSVNGNTLLNKNEYIDYGTRNLKIKCGKCGNIYQRSLANYVTSEDNRCPSCIQRVSKGEKIIMDVLDKYEVDYIFQMRFPDCKDIKVLPYDFYLPEYNLCIEFDGQLHYIPKYGEETFIKGKLHDAMKDWYCRWNNINLLRIPYWEGSRIEEILVNQLNLTPHIETQYIKIKYISNKKSA